MGRVSNLPHMVFVPPSDREQALLGFRQMGGSTRESGIFWGVGFNRADLCWWLRLICCLPVSRALPQLQLDAS
jgi:hypothetical protein